MYSADATLCVCEWPLWSRLTHLGRPQENSVVPESTP